MGGGPAISVPMQSGVVEFGARRWLYIAQRNSPLTQANPRGSEMFHCTAPSHNSSVSGARNENLYSVCGSCVPFCGLPKTLSEYSAVLLVPSVMRAMRVWELAYKIPST